MKKLYSKGQVHPSPSPSSSNFSLSYLPAAILTLAATLSSQDKEVLSYLLSCSSTTPFDFDPSNKSSKKHLNSTINHPHPPSFSCYCFSCYTNFWARWDSSPNRQLIHEIIDAFEDNLMANQHKNKNKKQGLTRKMKRKINKTNNILLNLNHDDQNLNHDDAVHGSDGSLRVNTELGRVDSLEDVDHNETEEKQGSNVRKIVTFISQRIWGSVWG
ncbi:unnamed protein product [Amaranthus hypochondriacus]